MNVQEVLQLVLDADIRLLAGLALLLILLLFWRAFHRISRTDKEISRVNERFERLREEVRSMGRKPLLTAVFPADQQEELGPVGEAAMFGEKEETEQPMEESFSFTTDSYRDDSFEGDAQRPIIENAEESPFDPFETETFSFDREESEEPAAAVDSSDLFAEEETASEKSFWHQDAGSDEELTAQEPRTVLSAEEAPVEEAPVEEAPTEEAPGIIKLEDDPARPDVCLARCMVCNYKLAYPIKLAGKRVRCPSCKSEHLLP